MTRNLLQYPITLADKIAALEWAIKQHEAEDAIGSIYGAALREILEELQAAVKVWGDK